MKKSQLSTGLIVFFIIVVAIIGLIFLIKSKAPDVNVCNIKEPFTCTDVKVSTKASEGTQRNYISLAAEGIQDVRIIEESFGAGSCSSAYLDTTTLEESENKQIKIDLTIQKI